MDFDLSAEQRRWRDLARDFAQGVIRPRAEALDREARFDDDLIGQMFGLGLMGLTLPPDYGGSGGDFVSLCLALEEIGRADTGIALTMQVQVALGGGMIAAYGTPDQKERFLAPCLREGRLWCFGLSEEEAGSDAGHPRTTAELRDGRWVINGSKRYITSAGTDITAGVTVLARTGWREPRDGGEPRPELTAFLVPQATPGYTRGPAYDKLGWRTSDQRPLRFDNCAVPEEYMLGPRGAGFRQCLAALDGARVAMGALSVGLARACLDEALAHARCRRQFGRAIAEFQAIQFKLADMAMEIELARTLVLKAAWLRDQGRPHGREASMVKVFASEAAKRAADQACQIHGGDGFMWASPVARYWRQVKINEIGEGTSEINRQIIARGLLNEVPSTEYRVPSETGVDA